MFKNHRMHYIGIAICLVWICLQPMAICRAMENFPEANRVYLPDSEGLIQKTEEILRPAQPLDFSRLSTLLQHVPEPIRRIWKIIRQWIGKLWEIFVRSRMEPRQQLNWMDWVRQISVPLIILTIMYFLYLLLRRFRLEIKEGKGSQRVEEEDWQKLWKNSWLQRRSSTQEAFRGLMKAVIRRLIIDGRIPDDPSQTLREIERIFAKRKNDDLSAFRVLRECYERVYYGQQTMVEKDWETVREACRAFFGEVPAE